MKFEFLDRFSRNPQIQTSLNVRHNKQLLLCVF